MATIFSSHAVYIESTDFYHDLSFFRDQTKLKKIGKVPYVSPVSFRWWDHYPLTKAPPSFNIGNVVFWPDRVNNVNSKSLLSRACMLFLFSLLQWKVDNIPKTYSTYQKPIPKTLAFWKDTLMQLTCRHEKIHRISQNGYGMFGVGWR